MYKSRKKSTPASQLSLTFDADRGALADVLDAAAERLSAIIRKSRYSRGQLADRLTYLLGREITTAQLNAWLSKANANRMPADVLIGLCFILRDISPIDELLAPLGASVADRSDRALSDLGRVQIEREALNAREASARAALRSTGANHD